MVSDETKRPDEAAMRRILDRYSDSPEGIILRLAWLEGLSREEIDALYDVLKGLEEKEHG